MKKLEPEIISDEDFIEALLARNDDDFNEEMLASMMVSHSSYEITKLEAFGYSFFCKLCHLMFVFFPTKHGWTVGLITAAQIDNKEEALTDNG